MKKTTLAIVIALSVSALSGCGKNEDAETLLNKGNSALADNNFRAANIEFKSLLEKDPNYVPARIGLAKVALELRDFDGALIELEKISSNNNSALDETIALLKARVLHRSAAHTALVKEFGDSVNSNPDEINYYLAAAKWGLDDEAGINEVLSNINKTSNYYSLAKQIQLLSAGKVDDIVVKTPSLSNERIFDSESSLLMFNIALNKGDIKEAISSLGQYHTLNPNDNQRRLQYVHLLVENGQHDLAKESLETLIKAFPKHAMINELNARILYQEQEYEKAMSAATLSIVSNPNGVAPRLIASYSAAKLNKPKEALDNLEFVIDKLPADHPAQRLYVRLKASEGDFDGLADRALSFGNSQEGDAELFSSLGLEMLRQGDKNSAERFANKAKETGEVTSNLGLLQLSLSDKESALKTLESAFVNEPDSVVAGNSLATAYLVSKEFDKAEKLAEEWISSGKEAEGTMLKGVISSRQGDMKEANLYFQSALNLNPNHFMAKAGVIETLVALGRKEEALSKLSEWLKDPSSLGLFRNYMASVQSLDGKAGVVAASKQFSNWLSEGVVKGDEAVYMNAQTLFIAGDTEGAKESLEKISDSSSITKRTDYWLLVATLSEGSNDQDGALNAFQKWQELSPKDPMPVMGEVRLLAESGRYKEATDVLDKTLPNMDEQTPGRILKAQLLMKQGLFPSMERELDKLPSEYQNSELVLSMKGVISANKGEHKRAVELLSPFVTKTGNEDLFRWLLYSASKLGDETKKMEVLSSQLEIKPESGLANFIMGNEKAESGSFEDAVKYYKVAEKTGAQNPLLFNNYAYSLMEIGKLDAALPFAKKANEMVVNPSYLDTLVEINIRLGDNDAAKLAIEDYKSAGGEVTEKVIELESKLNL
tara:strand:- start:6016 stop:8667 length:2652 start_codon:yes stop_codon:yes gene_type:complete